MRRMNALFVTADSGLVNTFAHATKEIGIEAHVSHSPAEISTQLNRAKFEALVLDFDTVSEARPILATARQSSSNKNAVVFAVATQLKHMEEAFEDRAHFVLKRPIDAEEVRRTLHTAYDLMRREHRKTFRCVANLPVQLRITNSRQILECSTLNVSSNGMAVSSPVPLKSAVTVDIELRLPTGFKVHASGIVVWGDEQGEYGLKIQCRNPESRHKLDSWLDSQYQHPPK